MTNGLVLTLWFSASELFSLGFNVTNRRQVGWLHTQQRLKQAAS